MKRIYVNCPIRGQITAKLVGFITPRLGMIELPDGARETCPRDRMAEFYAKYDDATAIGAEGGYAVPPPARLGTWLHSIENGLMSNPA